MSRTSVLPAPRDAPARVGTRSPPGRALGILISLGVVASTALACDLPTEVPQWDQRWIIPADRTTVGVEELLPDDVRLTSDRSAFTVEVEPISFRESLGNLCPACAPLDGLLAPKPAFQDDFHESVELPKDVEGAEVRRGQVVVLAQNGLSFDPLRPPGGNPGTVTLSLRDGGPAGPLLAQVLVDGATTSFSPGAFLTRVLEYSGPLGTPLTVTVGVNSPAGGTSPSDRVMVRLSDQIQVSATPQDLEVTSAVVRVDGRSFDLIDTELDVQDLDEGFVERVQSGAFLMEIDNPWSLGANLELTLRGPTLGSPIVKNLSVPAAPSSSVRVEFTRDELQSFLGQPGVTLTGGGTVAPGTGAVSVTPHQSLTVETRLDLVLRVG